MRLFGRAEPKRKNRSPRGSWRAPIDRVHDGIAVVGEVTFEDGSRWEGCSVSISEGETPESAVEGTIQSLIDQGEFELCFKRLDEPEPGKVSRDIAKPSY